MKFDKALATIDDEIREVEKDGFDPFREGFIQGMKKARYIFNQVDRQINEPRTGITLEELDSIYDEATKKVEDNPIYDEIYQNGILCGMRKLRTAIEVRLKSKGTIQDIVDAGKAKNIDNLETFRKWARSFDCDFDVKVGEKCETRTFDGVIGVHERTIDDDPSDLIDISVDDDNRIVIRISRG